MIFVGYIPRSWCADISWLKNLMAEKDGKRILQLNSYGSDDRDVPGKLSQTLQFDKYSAKQLHDVLKHEFGF